MADNRKFAEDALKAHNAYRSRHQAPPLKLDKNITKVAQGWADHLASTGTFQHSTDRAYKGENMGENIAMKWTSGGDGYTGTQATNQWYSEVSKYNYSQGGSGGTGHFSQVVWKASKLFGIGRSRGSDGKWIVVGNYWPAGNVAGQYTKNVMPPKDGNTSLIEEEKEGKKPGFSKNESHSMDVSQRSSSGHKQVIARKVTTTTTGVGANKVTKTVVTETIMDPDGTKMTVVKEKITRAP